MNDVPPLSSITTNAFPIQIARVAVFGFWLALLAGMSGAARGQSPRLTASALENGSIQLSWPATSLTFILEQSARVAPAATWSAVATPPTAANGLLSITILTTTSEQYFRLRAAGAPLLTRIMQTSPSSGESGVSVQRETILDFSQPLAAGTVLGDDTLYAQAVGRRLLSRKELSSDRTRISLFYLEPVPPGAHVVVRFDGDAVRDSSGQTIDADNDGRPGGIALIGFDTMNTAGLRGTGVSGYVFASDPVPSAAGFTNRPLAGVVISVDGTEERLRAETDETGFFTLSPCPPGTFFVHIDGRTAAGSDWPNGAYYPVVGKTFEAVAGQTNSRPTGASEIYLPYIRPGTLQTVSSTGSTVVSFPNEVTANDPALVGVSLTVPANSLFADDGTRGGKVGLAPVPPDRIPSPLPPGLDLPLVITVQTDGPSNFDQPVPVRFPNLPDPTTGEKLPPGAKSALWSFNHDTGRWEIQGSMTVTTDGNFVESDPGVGIRQPGWHGSTPGSTGQGGGGNDGPCSGEQQALEDALLGCAIGAALELAELAPAIGCGVSLASALASTINGCGDPQNNCGATAAYNAFFGVAGCIPGVGTFTGLMQCSIDLGSAVGTLAACQELNAAPAARNSFQLQSAAPSDNDPIVLQQRLSNAAGTLLVSVLGDVRWMEASARDSSNMVVFANAFSAALASSSDAAGRISTSERASLLALPSPGGLPLEVRTALLDRFDRFAAGGITDAEKTAVVESANSLGAISTQLQNAGWTTMLDGLKQTWSEVVDSFDDQAGGSYGDSLIAAQTAGLHAPQPRALTVGPPHLRELLYRLIDQTTGFTRFGKTDGSGQLSQFIVGPDRDYILTYLDPITLDVGSVYFRSGIAGGQFTLPRARLVPVGGGSDTDQDGLTDLMESVAGTSSTAPDTDNDGTLDLVEIQQGLNPLDGLALAEGVVSNLPLGGRALGLHVDGSQVFVANGKAGLAMVDATDPLQPIVLGQLDLLGESFDVTFSPEHQVAGLVASAEEVIPGERGLLHFVDVSNPGAMQLKRSYSMPAVALDSWNGLFYVALGQFAAKEVRIYDPASALEVAWFATQDYPTGLRVSGGRAYVATQSGLEIFDVTLPQPVLLGRLAGEFSVELLGRVHLVLDGTTLFISKAKGPVTIDVSDPTAPKFLGLPAANAAAVRSLALNGGGRMLALTMGTPTGSVQGAAFLSIYDVTDPANLNAFQFSLTTAGRARDLATLNGFALVADDQSGLTVLNFAAPDLNRRGPEVSYDSATLDSNATTPGIQIGEGAQLHISPRVEDDLHLDRVELLVGGQIVETKRTYPVSFALQLPNLALNSNQKTFGFQFRAVDRSGNATLGDLITVELTPDTQPPALERSMPAANGATYLGQPLVFEFNESLQATAVDASKIALLELGRDGVLGGGDDVAVTLANAQSEARALMVTPAAPYQAGQYQLTLMAGAVRDLAGNPTTQSTTLGFAVVDAQPGAAVWISDIDGNFGDSANWLQGRLPNQEDAILQRFGHKPVVTLGNAIVRNITIALPVKTTNRAGLTVLGTAVVTEPVELSTGSFVFQKSALFQNDVSITGAQVEANGVFDVKGKLALNHGGSLNISGTDAKLLLSGALEAVNCSIAATAGAIVDLPQLVTYNGPGDFSALFPVGTSFRAQGTGSRLSLPELTGATGPVNSNVRGAPSLRFEADDGGTLRLPKLTTLSGRTALVSRGFNSLLEAPLLSSIMGTEAPFAAVIQVTGASVLQVPALTDVTSCDVSLESDGILRGGAMILAATSSLQGAGTVDANVVNRGKLVLDDPEGLIIDGNLTLADSSQVVTTIGLGLDKLLAGRVDVRGSALLAGTIQIALARGYTAAAGNTFEAGVFAQPPSGAFAQVNDAALGNSLKAEVDVQPAKLTIRVTPRP